MTDKPRLVTTLPHIVSTLEPVKPAPIVGTLTGTITVPLVQSIFGLPEVSLQQREALSEAQEILAAADIAIVFGPPAAAPAVVTAQAAE